jgi:glycine/D-amino acid oxidase-like deaminating enzyme
VSSARISPTADVVVIGGGLIGTSIGWRLRQAGFDVVVVDDERATAWQARLLMRFAGRIPVRRYAEASSTHAGRIEGTLAPDA